MTYDASSKSSGAKSSIVGDGTGYTLRVNNNSGDTRAITLFQQFPSSDTGLPLVWVKQDVGNTAFGTFTWNVTWSMTWGTTPTAIGSGVMYTSGGTPAPMSINNTDNNVLTFSYDGDVYSQVASMSSDTLPASQFLGVGGAFDFSSGVNIGIYMNYTGGASPVDLPVFVTPLVPQTTYTFTATPTYYLAVTNAQQSTVIDMTSLSTPKEVQYTGSTTSLTYNLGTDMLFTLAT